MAISYARICFKKVIIFLKLGLRPKNPSYATPLARIRLFISWTLALDHCGIHFSTIYHDFGIHFSTIYHDFERICIPMSIRGRASHWANSDRGVKLHRANGGNIGHFYAHVRGTQS